MYKSSIVEQEMIASVTIPAEKKDPNIGAGNTLKKALTACSLYPYKIKQNLL
jgi:hypothetical protein